ncbi:MAG: DUF3793 family protein [Christensenellales bacterium]
MSEEMIINHCSPTLAGIKTGALFNCAYPSEREMRSAVRSWNKTLSPKGLRVLPLRYNGRTALIYIYRPAMLSIDLKNETARRLLAECGYVSETPEGCIVQLMRRFAECDKFPHEIGLFLGYPPEDVCGFIANKACGYKCAGYWKVYGDEETAKKTFAKFEKCTRCYCRQHAKGTGIERLAVAG